MSIQVFISGMLVGLLVGFLLCYTFLQRSSFQRFGGRKREIDRLTEQFQQLFRQINQDKNNSP